MKTLQPHQYQRDTLSAHAESLSKLSGRMVRGAEVLELGPAAGYFTRILKTALDCKVDAIEIDAEMAAKAKPHCREIIVADLDSINWQTTFAGKRYDTIIAADVLEHLRFPEHALRALVQRLKPGGKLLISLPNIAYAGMIFGLLEDDFRYRAEGLLDRTHLKFFTRTTLEEMLVHTGWQVSWRGEVRKDIFEAEFHTRVEKWPAALREFVLEHPARAAYQLLCECVPESAPKVRAADETGEKVPSAQFSARLMWADANGAFSFENGAVAFGKIGADRQTLSWKTPAQATRLRIRLADRAGFMHIHELRVVSPDGHVTVISLSTCTYSDDVAVNETKLTLGNPESWLQLPEAAYPAGAKIELECGWPMSGDYDVSTQAFLESQRKLHADIEEIGARRDHFEKEMLSREQLIEARDVSLTSTNEHVAHLEKIADERAQLVGQRDVRIAQLEAEQNALIADKSQLTQAVATLETTQTALQHRIAQLRSFREWFAHRFKS